MTHQDKLPAPGPANGDCAMRLTRIAELLREPLASIYGFAELLLTQDYDEETRRDLTATLLEQVEAMSNIINSELDMHSQKPVPSPPAGGSRGSMP